MSVIRLRRGGSRQRFRKRSQMDAMLCMTFWQYFDVRPAFTVTEKNDVYRLRYQVYCIERQFIEPKNCCDMMECDAFDDYAVHAMMLHRDTERLAGTMRVLLPEFAYELPTFGACASMSDLIDMRTTAEFSRFTISAEFRRRMSDGFYGTVFDNEVEGKSGKRKIPHIGIGLMREGLLAIQGKGVTHVCAMMEPVMMRMLEKLGIHFAPVGPLVEMGGLRQPCFAKVDSMLQRMRQERPDIWAFITDSGRIG